MQVSTNRNLQKSTTKPLPVATSGSTQKPRSGKNPVQVDLSTLKGDKFAASLKAALKPNSNNQVHEEMLQAGVIKSILEQAQGEAASQFQSALDGFMSKGSSTEDAVKMALEGMVSDGYITKGDANLINGISFRASQLDDNLEALYDDRGGKNDMTVAVDSMDNAVLKASSVLAKMQGGDLKSESRDLKIPSNTVQSSIPAASSSSGVSSSTAATSGSGGFLWKPVSESNGKLVVLLPSSLTGKVASVSIYGSDPSSGETPLDTGKFSANANGNRAHFRFSKPGSAYPDGSVVVATLKDGSQVKFQIGDSSSRNTK